MHKHSFVSPAGALDCSPRREPWDQKQAIHTSPGRGEREKEQAFWGASRVRRTRLSAAPAGASLVPVCIPALTRWARI